MTTRLSPEQAMSHPRRVEIVRQVTASPGISLGELARQMGIAKSPVDHHARILARAGLLVDQRGDGKRLFFPAGSDLHD